jgi:hypothetical protein
MDPGDAIGTTIEVWSQVGLVPGLVILLPSIILFTLLDWAIGNRIARRGRALPAPRDEPRQSGEGTSERCTPGSDGSIGSGWDSECGSPGS